MDFKEVQRLQNICIYEDYLHSCGFNLIAGVDEVGRGAIAGPIVAAAVILDRTKIFIEDINDSKKITSGKRKKLFKKIISSCICWSWAKLSPGLIDRFSLGVANRLVIKKALKNLKVKPDIIFTDAIKINMKNPDIEIMPFVNGDEISVSIAAASIIAKVIRDKIMLKYSRIYPDYDFEYNKGYGTKKHKTALKIFGSTEIHRLSFKNFFINLI